MLLIHMVIFNLKIVLKISYYCLQFIMYNFSFPGIFFYLATISNLAIEITHKLLLAPQIDLDGIY